MFRKNYDLVSMYKSNIYPAIFHNPNKNEFNGENRRNIHGGVIIIFIINFVRKVCHGDISEAN